MKKGVVGLGTAEKPEVHRAIVELVGHGLEVEMASRLKNSLRAHEDSGSVNATSHTLVPQVGVVVAVNENKGEITLSQGGGNSLRLTAHPFLLKDVRIWGLCRC
jgi:hypothetical protein